MNDNIVMKRIWQDEELFQITITCVSEYVTASTEVYVTDHAIDELYYKINTFLSLKEADITWESGEKGNQSTPSISMNFSMRDSSGHVQIEVFMELNDGGNLERHNCCFYLYTELGLLQNFNSRLLYIKNKEIGNSISLVESDF